MVTRGRPRSFDRDAALRSAMKLFWKLGYEGASMAALTAAMGINAPSLYACFGSKEGLFKEAVGLYLATEDAKGRAILDNEPTARGAIHAMLRNSVANVSRPGMPHGCLLILADSNAGSDEVRQFLVQRRRDILAGLEARLARGIADGDLPRTADVKALAAFYMTVLQGLSLRARDGATRDTMAGVVESAMAAWDGLIKPRSAKAHRTKMVAGRVK